MASPGCTMASKHLGATAARATTMDELKSELKQAVNSLGPNLIEVPVADFPSPWKHIHLPTIRGQNQSI